MNANRTGRGIVFAIFWMAAGALIYAGATRMFAANTDESKYETTAASLAASASALPSSEAAGQTAGAPASWQRIESSHATVIYSGVDKKWPQAFSAIYEAAREGYKEVLGIDLPEKVTIEIKVTGEETRLWTDGKDSFFLHLNSENDLLPTSKYQNVYGMSHEPGHIAMYSRMRSVAGLPEGVGEGWAHYCGSVITDYVWKKLGKDVYPVPFDYSISGAARLKSQCEGKLDDPTTLAACAFYKLGEKYGHAEVGRLMLAALNDRPDGKELMPRFVAAVRAAHGAEAAAMIPNSITVTTLSWKSTRIKKGEAPPDSFFAGLTADKDGWLHYDDGTNEGMRSIAGSGHAVLFRKKGGGKLAKVKMMGSRYGLSQSDSKFRIYVFDTSFSEIAHFEFPFMSYDKLGEELYWREFDMKATPVPDVFFVLFDFSPTATDGVYVGFDSDSRGHSFTPLPDSHLSDFDEGDWMIEAEVR